MYVNEAMTTSVKSCSTDCNLEDVSRIMWENDCGSVPVVDSDNKPIGIVTDRDIAMAAMINHKPLWEMKASDISAKQALQCSKQTDSIEKCLAIMETHGIRRVPVINEDGTLAGIVSMGDAVAFTQTGPTTTRVKQKESIAVDQTLAMLKHVSAHHLNGGDASPAISTQAESRD